MRTFEVEAEEAGGLAACRLGPRCDHGGGAADIVGYLTDFRITGNKLIANFHVLQNTPHRAYIFEIADKIPDTFGMSIAFSGPTEMASDKKTVLQRCSEIYSCDLVSEHVERTNMNPGWFKFPLSRQLDHCNRFKHVLRGDGN